MEERPDGTTGAQTETHYIPVISPPTPAQSPAPHDQPLRSRVSFLSAVLDECTRLELQFVSARVEELLRYSSASALPIELGLQILAWVDEPLTLVRMSAVSREWWTLGRDESIWKVMCKRWQFGDEDANDISRDDDGDSPLEEMEPYAHLPMDPALEWLIASKRKGKGTHRPVSLRSYTSFSFRLHFKQSYITLMNWRHGGRLLRSHRLPSLRSVSHTQIIPSHRQPPDSGVVTSVALDGDWVVVGLSSARIHVFSARTGVLARTLVGHTSGVWVVCLVSRSGGLGRGRKDKGNRSEEMIYQAQNKVTTITSKGRNEETKDKFMAGMVEVGKVTQSHAEEESNKRTRRGNRSRQLNEALSAETTSLDADLTNLRLDQGSDISGSVNTSFEGTGAGPTSDSTEHLLPPGLRIALGLPSRTVHHSQSQKEVKRSSNNRRSAYGDNIEGECEGAIQEVVNEDAEGEGSWKEEAGSESETSVEESGELAHEQPETAPPLPSNPTSKKSYTPSRISDPAFASEGWGQPNALVVSGGCDKVVKVWDVKSGHCIYTLPGHTSTIRCMRILHGRPVVVTGSRDGTVRTWDMQLGTAIHVLRGHVASVRCLDVNGNRVVSGSYDTTCRVWDIDTGECLFILEGHYHQVYSIAFDGVHVISGGLDTTIRIWDAETGVCVALLQNHTSLVCQLQLHPSLGLLVTGGSDGRIITFSLSDFAPLHRIAAHDSSVTGMQFDGRFLVTGGTDGRVRLFEADTGRHIRDFWGETANSRRSNSSDHKDDARSGIGECIWKVAFTNGKGNWNAKEGGGAATCAIMGQRAGKTVMEIWNFKPEPEVL